MVLPESKMVRERLWPPNGQQPTTARPEFHEDIFQRGDRMFFRFKLSCETQGASIAYRLGTSRQTNGAMASLHWRGD